MASPNSKSWEHFVTSCASALETGQMTTEQLRRALQDPKLRDLTSHYDFFRSIVKVCQERANTLSLSHPLMLEIEAVDRRYRQFIA